MLPNYHQQCSIYYVLVIISTYILLRDITSQDLLITEVVFDKDLFVRFVHVSNKSGLTAMVQYHLNVELHFFTRLTMDEYVLQRTHTPNAIGTIRILRRRKQSVRNTETIRRVESSDGLFQCHIR